MNLKNISQLKEVLKSEIFTEIHFYSNGTWEWYQSNKSCLADPCVLVIDRAKFYDITAKIVNNFVKAYKAWNPEIDSFWSIYERFQEGGR